MPIRKPLSYTLIVTTDAISKFPNGAIPGLTSSRLTDSATFSLCFFSFHQCIVQVAKFFDPNPCPRAFGYEVNAASLQRSGCGDLTPHKILSAQSRTALNAQNFLQRRDRPAMAPLAISGSGQSDVAKTSERFCMGCLRYL